MPRCCLRRGHPSHLPEQVLDDSGIAASLAMATALPRSFRIAVQLFVVEPLEHRSGEETIQLFGNKTTGIDKPEIEIVSRENGAMARICGRIDIDSSPALRAQLLTGLQAPGCNVLTVDVSAVTHIDSSGVATLIEALRIARSHNADLRLIGLQGRLLRLFQSTGILSLFNGSTRANSESGSKAV